MYDNFFKDLESELTYAKVQNICDILNYYRNEFEKYRVLKKTDIEILIILGDPKEIANKYKNLNANGDVDNLFVEIKEDYQNTPPNSNDYISNLEIKQMQENASKNAISKSDNQDSKNSNLSITTQDSKSEMLNSDNQDNKSAKSNSDNQGSKSAKDISDNDANIMQDSETNAININNDSHSTNILPKNSEGNTALKPGTSHEAKSDAPSSKADLIFNDIFMSLFVLLIGFGIIALGVVTLFFIVVGFIYVVKSFTAFDGVQTLMALFLTLLDFAICAMFVYIDIVLAKKTIKGIKKHLAVRKICLEKFANKDKTNQIK